jgi:hypothetical protein
VGQATGLRAARISGRQALSGTVCPVLSMTLGTPERCFAMSRQMPPAPRRLWRPGASLARIGASDGSEEARVYMGLSGGGGQAAGARCQRP